MEEWLSAPAAYPEARSAIEAMDPEARDELDRALVPVALHAGDVLYAPGDPRDAAFMIVYGSITVTGEDHQSRVLLAGEGVGEIGTTSRGPYTTLAQALDEARVLRLGRIAFEGLCERYPKSMSTLAEFITPVTHETLLARVVCDLLGERDSAHLAALLAEAECLPVKRGEVLIRPGEDYDRMFVVIYGRLRVVSRDATGTETVIEELGRGDTVGERSLLGGDAPSVTVYAVRDSAVGVITRPVFENLKLEYPEVMTRLTRIALRRVRSHAATPIGLHVSGAVGFALLPVGAARGEVPLAAFGERLASALSARGATLHLSSTRVDELLKAPGIAQAGGFDPGDPAAASVTSWLQRQEESYCYVVYEADDGWTPWTERCLQMADRVLLLACGGRLPVPTELDAPLARFSDCTETELVLLQPDDISRPSGTAAWLLRYPATEHHHIRLGRAADFNAFVRRITGRGLGLVLGGGAARGFAHIGVLHALEEYGIELDMVGGTSMGAILGAAFTLGLDHKAILKLAKEVASPLKLFDPTMPVVAFLASGKVTKVLERLSGDTQIEDLWLPYFCVSSNLTHAVAMVHRRGPLWQAVRASSAMPGIFSPILAEGDLLVDGCVLNNLPIDVMQRLNHDGPIIAVNVFPDVDLLRNYQFGPSVSGWQALASKLNPLRRRDSSAPLIFESLVRVLALNDVQQAKTKRGFADVYIRPPVEQFNIMDFGAYKKIADAGYRSAVEELGESEFLRNRERAAVGNMTARLQKALSELEDLLAGMG